MLQIFSLLTFMKNNDPVLMKRFHLTFAKCNHHKFPENSHFTSLCTADRTYVHVGEATYPKAINPLERPGPLPSKSLTEFEQQSVFLAIQETARKLA